jgi:hypothetical protein
MGAAGALLSEVKVRIVVDTAVRAGINTALAARTFFRVNDNQAVGSLINSPDQTRLEARGMSTVHAQYRDIRHLDFGHGSPDILIYFHPKLSGIWLGFGIGRPVIAAMFVLTDELAGIAARAVANINNKSLH